MWLWICPITEVTSSVFCTQKSSWQSVLFYLIFSPKSDCKSQGNVFKEPDIQRRSQHEHVFYLCWTSSAGKALNFISKCSECEGADRGADFTSIPLTLVLWALHWATCWSINQWRDLNVCESETVFIYLPFIFIYSLVDSKKTARRVKSQWCLLWLRASALAGRTRGDEAKAAARLCLCSDVTHLGNTTRCRCWRMCTERERVPVVSCQTELPPHSTTDALSGSEDTWCWCVCVRLGIWPGGSNRLSKARVSTKCLCVRVCEWTREREHGRERSHHKGVRKEAEMRWRRSACSTFAWMRSSATSVHQRVTAVMTPRPRREQTFSTLVRLKVGPISYAPVAL